MPRLDRLDADGSIEGYTVEVWGDELSPSVAEETAVGRELRQRIKTFRAWAADQDMSIDSFFPREPVHSELTGESYTRIRLPTKALAEYIDGELRYVSPCNDGETVSTVADHIESFEVAHQGPPATNGPL